MIWLLWQEQTGDKGRNRETMTIIQGEKGLDSGYILKIEPTGVAGLRCERKKRGE